MEHNHVRQPLIILAVITATLTALSFIPTQKVLPSFMKPIDVFADLKKDKHSNKEQVTTDLTKLKEHIAKLKTKQTGLLQDYSLQNENSFTSFIEKLQKANKTKVRIAYFGDSFIESDFVTHDLRQLLQQKYGGMGVGFVPITSVSAGMRKSMVHSFSSNWKVYNMQQHSNPYIGLSGYAFTATEQSNTSYTMPNVKDSFTKAQLLYGAVLQNTSILIKQDTSQYSVTLPPTNNLVNAVTINTKKSHAIRLDVAPTATMLYGCSFEDSVGVYIDNFSFRGTNGAQLMKLDTTVIQAFNQVKAYDLIVLHYGINVLGNNNTQLDWYKSGLNKTVQFIKQQFPKAAILIIGASDRSTKTNGEYITDAGVAPLLAIQQNIAQKNHTTFFNLYQAMGGNNSMVQWVQQKPALAEKDYIHLTFSGAQKTAQLIYNNLLNF
jgi:lysophospholipase L1-like esterase